MSSLAFSVEHQGWSKVAPLAVYSVKELCFAKSRKDGLSLFLSCQTESLTDEIMMWIIIKTSVVLDGYCLNIQIRKT